MEQKGHRWGPQWQDLIIRQEVLEVQVWNKIERQRRDGHSKYTLKKWPGVECEWRGGVPWVLAERTDEWMKRTCGSGERMGGGPALWWAHRASWYWSRQAPPPPPRPPSVKRCPQQAQQPVQWQQKDLEHTTFCLCLSDDPSLRSSKRLSHFGLAGSYIRRPYHQKHTGPHMKTIIYGLIRAGTMAFN